MQQQRAPSDSANKPNKTTQGKAESEDSKKKAGKPKPQDTAAPTQAAESAEPHPKPPFVPDAKQKPQPKAAPTQGAESAEATDPKTTVVADGTQKPPARVAPTHVFGSTNSHPRQPASDGKQKPEQKKHILSIDEEIHKIFEQYETTLDAQYSFAKLWGEVLTWASVKATSLVSDKFKGNPYAEEGLEKAKVKHMPTFVTTTTTALQSSTPVIELIRAVTLLEQHFKWMKDLGWDQAKYAITLRIAINIICQHLNQHQQSPFNTYRQSFLTSLARITPVIDEAEDKGYKAATALLTARETHLMQLVSLGHVPSIRKAVKLGFISGACPGPTFIPATPYAPNSPPVDWIWDIPWVFQPNLIKAWPYILKHNGNFPETSKQWEDWTSLSKKPDKLHGTSAEVDYFSTPDEKESEGQEVKLDGALLVPNLEQLLQEAGSGIDPSANGSGAGQSGAESEAEGEENNQSAKSSDSPATHQPQLAAQPADGSAGQSNVENDDEAEEEVQSAKASDNPETPPETQLPAQQPADQLPGSPDNAGSVSHKTGRTSPSSTARIARMPGAEPAGKSDKKDVPPGAANPLAEQDQPSAEQAEKQGRTGKHKHKSPADAKQSGKTAAAKPAQGDHAKAASAQPASGGARQQPPEEEGRRQATPGGRR